MPAALDIGQSIRGFVEVHVLHTGLELGIFKMLASSPGAATSEIASALAVPERAIRIWSNTAFAFSIVDYREGKIFLRPELCEPLADAASTKYAGDFLQVLVGHLGKDMRNQAEYCRAGRSYRFTDHDVDFVRPISRRGAQRAHLFIEKIVPMVPGLEQALREGIRVLDVGCGGGSFALVLAEEYPQCRFTGIDVCTKSIALAKEACSKSKMNERVEFLEGSPGRMNLQTRFDLVTMNLVLHEMEPQERPAEVRAVSECLKQDGRLLLLEFPYPEKEDEFFQPQFGMGILDQFYELIWGTEHLPWPGQERLLRDAGFRTIKRTFLGDNVYVLISAEK